VLPNLPASAHTHCLIYLVKKPVSAEAQPWDANYTHHLPFCKQFLSNFLAAGNLTQSSFCFRFVTAHRLARRALYALTFACKPLIFLIFYKPPIQSSPLKLLGDCPGEVANYTHRPRPKQALFQRFSIILLAQINCKTNRAKTIQLQISDTSFCPPLPNKSDQKNHFL
jgi:hypothetical protein